MSFFRKNLKLNHLDGLIGWWKFDEEVGNIAIDSSGNGNHGQLVGVGGLPYRTNGKIGKSIRFDGIDDYIDTSDIIAMDSLSAYTISAWVKLDTTAINQTIAGKHISVGLFLQTYTTSQIAFGFTPSNFVYSPNGSIAANIWYHIVGTFNNSLGSIKHKIYINGTSVFLTNSGTPDSVTSTGASAGNFHIGKNNSLDRFLAGLIDDVRVYNRAISAQEVVNLYNYKG
jgi:hypothetical protein